MSNQKQDKHNMIKNEVTIQPQSREGTTKHKKGTPLNCP